MMTAVLRFRIGWLFIFCCSAIGWIHSSSGVSQQFLARRQRRHHHHQQQQHHRPHRYHHQQQRRPQHQQAHALVSWRLFDSQQQLDEDVEEGKLTETNHQDDFFRVFREMGFHRHGKQPANECEQEIQLVLEKQGLWDNDSKSSFLLQTICRDYYTCQQPDQLTRMLQTDFGLGVLPSHMVRSTLWRMYEQQGVANVNNAMATKSIANVKIHETEEVLNGGNSMLTPSSSSKSKASFIISNPSNVSRPLYKQVTLSAVSSNRTAYGLPSIDDSNQTRVLRQEIDQFWHEFMTRPNPYHPTSTPLRNATAEVYVRHANLFLGWYMQHQANSTNDGTSGISNNISLRDIFADETVGSVSILLDFVRWLRENRNIAASYEGNLWRGLTKLLQFRYTQLEDQPAAVLETLPALLQIRKWHREAQNAAKKAPRRSQEDRKWLSWEDYLQVVHRCKQEFLDLEKEYNTASPKSENNDAVTPQERKIAIALQRYLVLAIFATVPDRQRTIRELQLHKSLVKDSRSDLWCIKHSPKDYKTGKTYGERPSLQLHGLTQDIDAFIGTWRPKLQPLTDYFFVQTRTRKPFTQDSVYQLVGRACYEYTGQRTNPHLLRDMIVTHVRESTATSEAELEALAMLMGHSVAVQRSSYDRRTLTQKVAPAVDLMQKVNGQSNGFSLQT